MNYWSQRAELNRGPTDYELYGVLFYTVLKIPTLLYLTLEIFINKAYNSHQESDGVGCCFKYLAYIVPTQKSISGSSDAKAQIDQVRG